MSKQFFSSHNKDKTLDMNLTGIMHKSRSHKSMGKLYWQICSVEFEIQGAGFEDKS